MALGCIAYFVTVMGHEILGHGVAMYLSGIHGFALTSTSIDALASEPRIPDASAAGRLISMAGSAFNVLFSLFLFRVVSRAGQATGSPALHFGMRLLATVTLSLGLVYLLFSGIFGVGDWAAAIVGLPATGLLRSIEIGVGLAGLYCAARMMAGWLPAYRGNRQVLVWAPYLAAIVAFSVIGARVPDPNLIVTSVLPAPILGQMALVLAPLLVPRAAGRPSPAPYGPIARSWPAIGLAGLCLVAAWFLAPGVAIRL
jgi:hypothetical protein